MSALMTALAVGVVCALAWLAVRYRPWWMAVAVSPLLIVAVPSGQAQAAEYVDLAAICDALDERPAVGTLMERQEILWHDGYSIDRASQVVVGAVFAMCPEHMPVLDALTEADA